MLALTVNEALVKSSQLAQKQEQNLNICASFGSLRDRRLRVACWSETSRNIF